MSPRLHWIRAGDRYPDLKDETDDFIALAGETEVGVVKWIESGPDHGWVWSMTLVSLGPAFRMPTNGRCETRGEAARELRECYAAFRRYYGLDG